MLQFAAIFLPGLFSMEVELDNEIQLDLDDKARKMAKALWKTAYRYNDTTEKTITVAEKEVNGWYYLVAVSKVNVPAQPW